MFTLSSLGGEGESSAYTKIPGTSKKSMVLAIIGCVFLWLASYAPVSIGLITVLCILLLQIGLRYLRQAGDWPNVTGTEYRFPFGDLPDIQASQDGLHLMRLKASLGHPKVYRIWLGPQPTLMLAHPEAVRQFWQFHNEQAIVREVKMGWAILLLMHDGIGFLPYRDRNRMAKFFHSCFGQGRVAQFDADIEFETDRIIDRLDKLTAQNNIIDISSELKYLTHHVCAHFLLGPKWYKYQIELRELNDTMFRFIMICFEATWINLPVLQWLLPKSLKLRWDILKFRRHVDTILHELIDEYKVELEEDDAMKDVSEHDSILVRFIKMQAQGKSDVTFLEIMDTLIESLLFPTDATAGTFVYTLILLSWNDHVQTKARQLVLEQLQNRGKSSNDAVTLDDIRSIEYLDWILNECQRMLPIFMYNVPEYTSQAMTICGVTVPKDTMTTYDVQSLNRGDDIWDEPFIFRPERHQSLTEQQRKAIHAFGNGRTRRCLGEHLIKSLHKFLIARILLRFRIETMDENRNIDQIPRQRGPFFFAPNIPLRFVPL